MPNVLVVPVSGTIFFDRNVAGASTIAALNSAVRLSYDQGGGLNITSYTTALTALDRFTVDGAQGRLFSVADSLTGSLMSVNDIAGLPILEVLDTDTVIAGSYNTNAFIVSGTRIGISTRPFDTSKLGVSGNVSVIGSISSNSVVYGAGGNSVAWNGQYSLITSNFNIVAGSFYAVNTTSTIIRGTLPASPTFGDTITFIDPYYIWDTNNFVLERNGNNIESVAESLSANLNGFTFKATYVGASIGWRVY